MRIESNPILVLSIRVRDDSTIYFSIIYEIRARMLIFAITSNMESRGEKEIDSRSDLYADGKKPHVYKKNYKITSAFYSDVLIFCSNALQNDVHYIQRTLFCVGLRAHLLNDIIMTV